jgi:exopolyphosphatase/guanosine-5'-triphosphate,3'-diphosphate pyrophosphatase
VISAAGVREGLIYDRLTPVERAVDPLLFASREVESIFARAPGYGDELIGWVDDFMRSGLIDETVEEKRLRHAACLLSDIAWRAHPEYRAQRALNVVTQGPFVSIDHPGRAFLSMAIVLRHEGPEGDDAIAELRSILTTRLFLRARVLGAAMRVAYLLSASMPGVLPRTTMRLAEATLKLSLPSELTDLASDRVLNRLKSLGRLLGVEAELNIQG